MIYSESFFGQPANEFARLSDFLGLPPISPQRFDRYNARPARQSMSDTARKRLSEHYRESNAHLADIVGATPPWDKD